jgi:citrate synthase
MTEYMSAREAAQKLGIRPASLYAYVSRGHLSREVGPDRRSLFLRTEVERMAERGRPRTRPEVADVPVHSDLTAVSDGTCFLRGRNLLEVASELQFEAASEWFWTGAPVASASSGGWPANPAAENVAGLIDRVKDALPLDQLRVAVAALAPADPVRYDLAPETVIETARRMISGLVDSLARGSSTGTIADRLWVRLGGSDAIAVGSDLLNQALVLLLDHDLSLSTLAARVAASLNADPYAVVAVGLNALGAPLHSVAALAAEDLLSEVDSTASPRRVLSTRLRDGGRLPGFGHRLYPQGDPRARGLFQTLGKSKPPRRRMETVEGVIELARSHRLPPPNIDFALAAIAHVYGLTRGASEAIFAIARSSGWIAHALEQYERGVRLQPRLVYLGAPHPLER